MSEKVAKAIGAPSPEPIKINGKEVEIRPIPLKHLVGTQRECLKQFRRRYLENYKDSMDLTGKTQMDLEAKIDEVGRWDLTNLPFKNAYDSADVVVTPDLIQWLNVNVLKEFVDDDNRIKLIAASALDGGVLTEADYKTLTGEEIKTTPIAYVFWWTTATIEGMVATVHSAVKDQGITKDDVYKELGDNFAKLAELSREIESISKPEVDEKKEPVGNAEGA